MATGSLRIIRHGEPDYEGARRAAVWRRNVPDRYPAAIAQAYSATQVAEAVAVARREGLPISAYSGGHGWTSAHLRDGAMLIDVSRLRDCRIDAATRTAWVGPGLKGRELNDRLAVQGLMVPTGHHDTVACGGFLLCGGFGWNFRQWGNGCANVVEVEVVTAAGDILRASATQHSDWFFAARGGGAGFFGVITGFRVRAYPRPALMRANTYVFDLNDLEPVLDWLLAAGPEMPAYAELLAAASSYAPDGGWAPSRLVVSALSFSNTEAEAEAVSAVFRRCPLADRAVLSRINLPTTLEERYALSTAADPPGHRYAADNLYLSADGARHAMPRIAELFRTMPTPRSHVFWLYQGKSPLGEDMALSTWGEIYVAAYAIWDHAADDAAMESWATSGIGALSPWSQGAQMNDEAMFLRPDRYLSEHAEHRLRTLSRTHDPDGLFLGFLTRESAAAEMPR